MSAVSNLDGQNTDALVREVAAIWSQLDDGRRTELAEEAQRLMEQQAAEDAA